MRYLRSEDNVFVKSSKDVKGYRANEKITSTSIRLIGADGTVLGLISKEEALAKAQQEGLDLVEMAITDGISNCKLLDYSRLIFDIKRKQKKKKPPALKEIRLSVKIGDGDFKTKINQATKMLLDGHKVRFVIRFSGRESMHPELGFEIMNRVIKDTETVAKIDSEAKRDGMKVFLTLAPLK